LVPIIHLIFGFWPVNFNFWVTVGMIVHYAVRAVMLHFAESPKQMRALWLSRIAVSNYWFADLKAAFLIPVKRIVLGDDVSFRSRAWSRESPVRNIKALILPLILVIMSLVAFVGGCLMLKQIVNLPTVLSLCCVVINIMPPFLLLLRWVFGPGQFLARLCTLFMSLSWVAGCAAFVFLWFLWPRDVDFKKAAEMSLSFLDAQRSGLLPYGYPITWRKASGEVNIEPILFVNETANLNETKRVDLSGGFYNDGDVGPIKVTWNIAMTTSMLAWSLIEYGEFWERDALVKEHAIGLLAHGLEYIESCYQLNPIIIPGVPQSTNLDQVIYVVCSRCFDMAGSLFDGEEVSQDSGLYHSLHCIAGLLRKAGMLIAM
jgi:hypothetical protein